MKQIIEENKNRIRVIIKRFLGNNNEDLEQEIFLKVWKKLDSYKEENKFTQWISTIASNVCKDFLKSKSFKNISKEVSDENYTNNIKSFETPEKIYDKNLRGRLILKAIDNLPKKMKEVVIMYEFENKSYEDISNKLKIPVGTIKSRLFNARKLLMEQLKELL